MISEQHFIRMRDDVELHAQVQETGASTWLIATHGIGEHLGRHSYIGDLFSGQFNLFQYDLRGHGLSMGRSAYVEDFWDYMHDLEEILCYLKKRYKMNRFALFGHSMGALITAGFLQRMAHKDLYPEVVFLNAPPVGYPGILGKIIEFSPQSILAGLAGLPVSLRLGGLVDLNFLSHDVRVKERYLADTKNALTLHSKLLLEMVKASREVFTRPLRPLCQAFVTVGSCDRVIDVPSLLHYFTMVEKSFILNKFEGAFHEIHNEVEKFRVPYFDFVKESIGSILIVEEEKS